MTTDTQPLAPTDAEIFAVAREAGLLPDNSHPAPETRAARKHSDAVRAFARAALAKWGAQPVARDPLTCEWTHNDDDGYWDTSCGKAWRFDDGGPKENNMNFCHCCGKTLRIKGGQHGTE